MAVTLPVMEAELVAEVVLEGDAVGEVEGVALVEWDGVLLLLREGVGLWLADMVGVGLTAADLVMRGDGCKYDSTQMGESRIYGSIPLACGEVPLTAPARRCASRTDLG